MQGKMISGWEGLASLLFAPSIGNGSVLKDIIWCLIKLIHSPEKKAPPDFTIGIST